MRKLLIIPAILAVVGVILLLFSPSFAESVNLRMAELMQPREISIPPADLLDAKTRWIADPIIHYRLVIHHLMQTYPFTDCLQDVEVQNEQIVQSFVDSCAGDGYLQHFAPLGRTVTELFAEFQSETTTIHYIERDNPGCGHFLGVNVSYASRGYPVSAQYRWLEVSPWTLGSKTYQALYPDSPRINTCMTVADARKPNMTIVLEPLS